jgi:lambda family phage minor tail protein L
MTIEAELQKPVLPNYIELFTLDLSPHGGPNLYITPSGVGISFGSQEYTPLPMKGDGWETSVDGAAPQPTITISNATKFIQAYMTTYKDFIGCTLTRQQTFDIYLDSGTSPDSNEVFNTSVYIVEQKVFQRKNEVQFLLSSIIDKPNFKLPRGQVLRTEFPGAGVFRKSR